MGKLRVDDKDIDPTKDSLSETWHGNPLTDELNFYYYPDNESREEKFTTKNLKSLDSRTGTYTFENEKGSKLTLTPKKKKFVANYDTVASIKATVTNETDSETEIVEIPRIYSFDD